MGDLPANFMFWTPVPCAVMFDRGMRKAEVLDTKSRTRDDVVRSFISLDTSAGRIVVE